MVVVMSGKGGGGAGSGGQAMNSRFQGKGETEGGVAPLLDQPGG